MKASKKLYKALVYRGPLQPRPVNHLVTNPIQKKCLLMYLKQSEMQYSGMMTTVKITIQKLAIQRISTRYL